MNTPLWPFKLKDSFNLVIDTKVDASGQSEFKRWERDIIRGFGGVTDKDICKAIELGVDLKENLYGKPCVSDIRRWLYTMLARRNDMSDNGVPEDVVITTGDSLATMRQEHTTLSEMKQRIRKAKSNREIWDIACMPSNIDQCRELERFANMVNANYERPTRPTTQTNKEPK